MSFKFVYEQAVSQAGFLRDAGHTATIDCLDRLYRDLIDKCNKKKPILSRFFFSKIHFGGNNRQLQGCYIWGNVGRGKTWLMDLFFQAIPSGLKMRLHFADFMQQVHNKLGTHAGRRDPLHCVADDLAQIAQLICLDEFHVDDIADAMLLYGLLEALFRRGVVLVVTANVTPDNLYLNGLQRERFLPAIELIKKHNNILYIAGEHDFRNSSGLPVSNYFHPLSQDTDLLLEQRFYALASGPVSKKCTIMINGRPIMIKMSAENTIWFEFTALCEGPRSAVDYIQLADRYENIVISNVYRLTDMNEDVAKRFILLVDTLYDRRVNVIFSATATPDNLYQGRLYVNEFKRTASRLQEIARCDNPIVSTCQIESKISTAK